MRRRAGEKPGSAVGGRRKSSKVDDNEQKRPQPPRSVRYKLLLAMIVWVTFTATAHELIPTEAMALDGIASPLVMSEVGNGLFNTYI